MDYCKILRTVTFRIIMCATFPTNAVQARNCNIHKIGRGMALTSPCVEVKSSFEDRKLTVKKICKHTSECQMIHSCRSYIYTQDNGFTAKGQMSGKCVKQNEYF